MNLCMAGNRLTVFLGLCLFILVSCGQADDDLKVVKNGGIFVYPGTEWNMTPEDAKKAMGFSDSQFSQFIDMKNGTITEKIFLVEGETAFGREADTYFWFRSYDDDLNDGLKAVTWIFEEDTDMESVRQKVEASFGNAEKIDMEHSLLYWFSEDKVNQYMSDSFLKVREERQLSKYPEDDPAVSLILVNDPDYALPLGTLPSVQAHAKMLILTGNLADVLQINQILQKSDI